MNRGVSRLSLGACISLVVALSVVASFGAGSQAAQEAQQKAASMLTAAAEAAGGSSLTRVDSLELNTRRVAFLSGHNQGQSDVDVRLAYPSQMRLEVKLLESQTTGGYGGSGMPGGTGPVTPMSTSEHPVFTFLEGCDGTTWWRKTPSSVEDRQFAKSTQLRIDLVGALGLYRSAAAGKLEAKFVGEQQVQGRQVHVAVLSDGTTKLYFDPQIHLLAGVSYSGAGAEGTFDAFRWWADFVKITFETGGREQTVWWGDYRRAKFKVEGKEEAIQFPYLWTSYLEGTKVLEEKVTSLKINAKHNPKLFAKPK
jgi:hypothetical protein